MSRPCALMCAMALALGTVTVSGQECPSEVGVWGFGPVEAVAAAGPYLVLASGRMLIVARADDLSVVGETLLGGAVRELAVGPGWVAAAAGRNGVRVVDLQDPTEPREITAYATLAPVETLAASDDLLVVGEGRSTLLVLDLSDPNAPVALARELIQEHLLVVRSGRQLALVAKVGDREVDVYDLRDPTRPLLTSTFEGYGVIGDMTVVDDRVYCSSSTFGDLSPYSQELLIEDLSDLHSPVEVGSLLYYPGAFGRPRLAVANGRALVGNPDLRVIDVADPTHPRIIGDRQLPYGAEVQGLASSDNLVAAASGDLTVFDLSGAHPPDPVAAYQAPSGVWHVSQAESLAQVVSDQLLLFDVEDPARPRLIGSYDDEDWGWTAAAAGHYSLLGEWFGLRVVDVSDPADPRAVAFLGLEGMPQVIAIVADRAYLATRDNWETGWSGGLHVVDISDPVAPRELGSLQLSEGPRVEDIAVADGFVLLAWPGGLTVVDVSQPESPRWVAEVDTPGTASTVATTGTVAVVGGSRGLQTFDLSEPSQPVGLGALPDELPVWDVVTRDDVAFAMTDQEVVVVDLSDPTEPEVVRRLVTAGWWEPYSCHTCGGLLSLAGDSLLVADGEAGVAVLDVSGCAVAAPVASFTWSPEIVRVGDAVQLLDTSSGLPSTWRWDFRDGGTSTEQNPAHAFSTPGTRRVSLTVTNRLGGDIAERDVTVAPVVRRPAGRLGRGP